MEMYLDYILGGARKGWKCILTTFWEVRGRGGRGGEGEKGGNVFLTCKFCVHLFGPFHK